MSIEFEFGKMKRMLEVDGDDGCISWCECTSCHWTMHLKKNG